MTSKKTSQTKKPFKDTPPAERYAGIIAEEFSSRFDLLFENIETIRSDVNQNIRDLEEKMMKGFANVDLRFIHVDQRFDKVEGRLDRVEGRLEKVEGEIEKVSQDLKETRNELSEKIDRVGNRMTLVESDLTRLKEAHP
jgi:chromosome segregation ATPase